MYAFASRINIFYKKSRQDIFFSLSYLSEVVKVVFVVNPSIVGCQTVGFVGDVLHIETHTVEELSFEELGRKNTRGEGNERPTKIHFDEVMTTLVCSHFSHAAFEVIS